MGTLREASNIYLTDRQLNQIWFKIHEDFVFEDFVFEDFKKLVRSFAPVEAEKETVYVKVDIKELPKEAGYYPVYAVNNSTLHGSIDELKFTGSEFMEIPNWTLMYWLKEKQVIIIKK